MISSTTIIADILTACRCIDTNNYQYLHAAPKPDTNYYAPANKQERQLKIAIVYKTIKQKK